ncbi:MAG: C10 family peptidase [Opitutaceae bacterium]|jgi:hypothetical protein
MLLPLRNLPWKHHCTFASVVEFIALALAAMQTAHLVSKRFFRRSWLTRIVGWLSLIGFVGLSCSTAAPISQDRAAQAARRWLELSPSPMERLAGKYGKISTYSNAVGEARFYVVDLEPTGYVVIAADDEVEAVIAFSHDDKFVAKTGYPLFDFLQRDTEGRIQSLHTASIMSQAVSPARVRIKAKWELLSSPAVQAASVAAAKTTPRIARDVASANDVRVDPLIQSKWDQGSIYQGTSELAVYNYYTPPYASGNPGNYPAGCTATALAQIMRYHQWPVVGVGTRSFNITVDGVLQPRALRGGDGAGGPYDWANMVLFPDSGLTSLQCQAIGALLVDVGVANYMDYMSDGSGGLLRGILIKNVFHYANAVTSSGSLVDITRACPKFAFLLFVVTC